MALVQLKAACPHGEPFAVERFFNLGSESAAEGGIKSENVPLPVAMRWGRAMRGDRKSESSSLRTRHWNGRDRGVSARACIQA